MSPTAAASASQTPGDATLALCGRSRWRGHEDRASERLALGADGGDAVDAAQQQRVVRDEEVGAGVDGLLTTASVGSTARCTRRTGWSRSPATSPTWSQSIAVSGGYTDSSAATTSRSVSGSSRDTSRQCHTPVSRRLYGGRMRPQPPSTAVQACPTRPWRRSALSEALEVVESPRLPVCVPPPHRDGR